MYSLSTELSEIRIFSPSESIPLAIIVPLHIRAPLKVFFPECNHDCSRRHSLILFHCFSVKTRLDISCESSARQRIYMKDQALFSSKDKNKKIKV